MGARIQLRLCELLGWESAAHTLLIHSLIVLQNSFGHSFCMMYAILNHAHDFQECP